MAKTKTHYACQTCGQTSPRWLGRCPGCGEWNTLAEELLESGSAVSARSAVAWVGGAAGGWVELQPQEGSGECGDGESDPSHRISTGIGELDRVLGGGLVSDSFVLLGGEPGIGKSTLILQMARGVRRKVLYVSGEESVGQIRSRARRLGIRESKGVYLSAENRLEQVLAMVKELEPEVVILDSLQTFVTAELESAPGSVGQVREVSARLMTLAKNAGISVWLIGHVTKEGGIAGPKVIEHMVDTVLYFEGDGGQNYRLLRAVKNRFGSSRELGVFEMVSEGLEEVKNPSSLFLSERREAVPGTAVGSSMEGTRTLLVELQALVSSSPLAVPRRTSVGMDSSRVALMAAILERHMRVSIAQQDLFFNVAGGLRLSEPACDLAAVAAIWSSAQGIALPRDWIFIGEVGLTGEVRRVSHPDLRIEEAKKLGFSTAVVPKSVMERCEKISGIKLIPVSRVSDLGSLTSTSAGAFRNKSLGRSPSASV